jgi:cell division protein FtsZ
MENLLKNVDVVFIVASLGGGTGTGAAPIVADIARRKGAVVVGVVTTPLRTEKSRLGHAAQALNEMRKTCDTVVVIDSNKIAELIPEIPSPEAFKLVDQVLANIIKDIVETLSSPSLINLDFADFKTLVKHGGVAVVGVGESNASNRAEEAVQSALRNSLIDLDFTGARGALIQVSGDPRMTVEEVNRVGEIVSQVIGDDASVIWGARVNPQAMGNLKVTLVMTGVHSPYGLKGVGDILPELYDIESSYRAPEKSLPIDLGLDQIENFEE